MTDQTLDWSKYASYERDELESSGGHEMKSGVYSSFKAEGPIPDTVLEFSITVPRSKSLAEQRSLLANEASKLETILHFTLPGGLYDHLFAAMARRTAGLLVISRAKVDDA